MERGLHPGRDAQQQAAVSGQALFGSAQSHSEHNRLAERGGPQLHTERSRARLPDQFGAQAQGALREDISEC